MAIGQSKRTKMRVAGTLSYAGRMLRSLLSGEPLLVTAKIHPTYRCNLRCTYCNLPNLNIPELTTDQWLAVIDELADLGCRRLSITGGEPLVRQDVADFITRARERGMSCSMVSNGVLVKRRIDDLRQLSSLTLSLDALGSANDEVRGEGVFDAVREAISAAKVWVFQCGSTLCCPLKQPRCSTNCWSSSMSTTST